MERTRWGRLAIARAIIVGLAMMLGLMGSTVHAENGWNDSEASSIEGAKKPPPPPPLSIAGSWVGTIQDNIKGPGTVSLTFAEKLAKTKGTLTGTWQISFPDTAPRGAVNDFGTVKGTVVGSAVSFALVPKKGDAIGTCKNMFHSTEATLQGISASFGGCGHTGTISIQPGPASTLVFINIGDDFFYPPKVTISAGQTVRWTNNGGEQHTINSNPGTENCKPAASNEAFDSPTINSGDTVERTFNTPGTFAYHCEIHGCPMKGTITVN